MVHGTYWPAWSNEPLLYGSVAVAIGWFRVDTPAFCLVVSAISKVLHCMYLICTGPLVLSGSKAYAALLESGPASVT